MLRKEKEPVIEEVTRLLSESEMLFVADYRGLSVAQITELRGQLRSKGARLRVLKNTLTRIAADRGGREPLHELLSGPTAITFCGEDAVGAAKTLIDFARSNPQLAVRGGLLGESVIDGAAVKALAVMPPREVLLAQLVGTMAGPLSGLVTVLHGTIGGFVRALQRVADQKAAAGEA